MKNYIKKRKLIFWTIFLFFLLLTVYGVWIEPNRIVIQHFKLKDSGMGNILANKTIVHLSDLHISRIGQREKRILAILEDLKPDIILLTGDYVKRGRGYKHALEFFSRLRADIGIWAVMGDYDYSNSRKSCLFCHEQGSGKPTQLHNVTFLRNEVKCINMPGGNIWLGGVDRLEKSSFTSDGNISFMEDKNPVIILSHSPLIFDLIDKNKDVLVLAGDTHGGQIYFPPWLWSILGYIKCTSYNQGFFKEGRKKMYVSRGIGTSHLPIRLFSPPELVVLHF